ncbi:Rpn family recombination-promoting nuclease/putative transposase [Nocardia halotolerans]|uniref:Rpn family recombination-promoting nuclease/putative transposase n=1 Tax=Nocardia halotolerans TaxID=1755878 RepID=A0ABV8VJZ6_9NOCA
MTVRPTSPHDALCRRVLGRPENAASELRSKLPEAFVAQADWPTLKQLPTGFISPRLTPRYGDLLFSVQAAGQETFIYCLIEHQSSTDKWMSLRLIEYMVAIWTRYVGDDPQTTTLPAIIPLVVHADPKGRRWSAPTELSELFALSPPVRASLGDLVPRMRYLLDDMADTDLAELRKRELTPAVLVMLYVLKVAPGRRDAGTRLLPLVEDVAAMFDGPNGRGDLQAMVEYIITVSDTDPTGFDSLFDRLGPQAQEVVMTTAEKLEARGMADALLRQLNRKFGEVPESVVARVRSAQNVDLERWIDQILTASTMDETLS